MKINPDLLYYVGTAWTGDPGKLDEYNDWYSNEHLPHMMCIPGVVRGDRYVKLDGDNASAPYLASYVYENIEGWQKYKSNPVRTNFLQYAGWVKFPEKDAFQAYYHALHVHTGKFDKDILNDGGGDTNRILYIVGGNLTDAAMEDEFNDWYNSRHIPQLLQFPGIVKADRYKWIEGVEGDDPAPMYVAVYEFLNKVEVDAFEKSDILKEAREDLRNKWQSGDSRFQTLWKSHYQRMGTWYSMLR